VTTTGTARVDGPRRAASSGPRPTRLWWLVVAGALVAVLGIVLSVVLVLRPDLGSAGGAPAAVGEPVRTRFGTFTVTGVSTTFVPDTQGPPTSAQHAGTRGSDQLQVRVRLTNDRWARGVSAAPSQFRLVGDGGAAPRRPSGSTLTPASLPRGATVDGQMWFDAVAGPAPATQWLEYLAPDGQRLRVVVRQPASPKKSPSGSPTVQHGH
jgi:hypothetical protein